MTTHCSMSTYTFRNSKQLFCCYWWINFSLIWHLKHLMEKLSFNENVLSLTYNWIHSNWCWVHVQKKISRKGILKLVHWTWKNPSQPTILAHRNSTSPIIIHYRIFDISFTSMGLVFLWCGKLHSTISCLFHFDAICFGIWKDYNYFLESNNDNNTKQIRVWVS
jgi:hypothetical protein